MMLEHSQKTEIPSPVKESFPLSDCNKALIPGGELPSGQKRPEFVGDNFPRAGIDSYLLGGSLLGEIDRTWKQEREKPVDLRIVRNTPEELNRMLFAPEEEKKSRDGVRADGRDREETAK
ncbi:MAG: hypothetical protein IK105_07150 [Thermoguttaceae bacterium]|nr:hypothetical protein [Thermoguttaceae bacterium]